MSKSNGEVLKLRQKIDRVDKAIIEKIAERMRTSRAIGVLKKKHGLPIRNTAREQQMNVAREHLARSLGLDKKIIARIFKTIINESRKAQK